MASGSIRVLIVDDSALVRSVLKEIIEQADDLEVVDVARDPYEAREKIKALNPDVLTLDVEMPKMDGITFLRNLMRLRPMPVVMVSSLTDEGADETLQALELGAFDFVTKPQLDVASQLESYAEEIIEKIRGAARSRPRTAPVVEREAGTGPVRTARSNIKTTDRVIAIGASTGGTTALQEVLEMLPSNAPGIVITQHIPGGFSAAFAERVNQLTAVTVVEATDGQRILPGHAYVAPGNRHLRVRRDGARYICKLSDDDPVNRHRPSVDVLFYSVADQVGANAVGVIMTGMGRDGADGLAAMKEAGSPTIAQDEDTSVVWGMPGEAVRLDVVDQVVPLDRIAQTMLDAVAGMGTR